MKHVSSTLDFLRNMPRGVGSFFKVGGQDTNIFSDSKKCEGKCSFSIKVKQKSVWASTHPTNPALTLLMPINFWQFVVSL